MCEGPGKTSIVISVGSSSSLIKCELDPLAIGSNRIDTQKMKNIKNFFILQKAMTKKISFSATAKNTFFNDRKE